MNKNNGNSNHIILGYAFQGQSEFTSHISCTFLTHLSLSDPALDIRSRTVLFYVSRVNLNNY